VPSTTTSASGHVDVEEHAEEHQHQRLHHEHQEQIARELAEEDGPLVARSEQEALPAVVLPLDHEGAAEREQPAEHEPQP